MLLVGMSLLVALVAAEALLRLIGYSHSSFYRADPYCGASLRPGAEGWWTKEGRSHVVINSQGLRDREHQFKKPEGTFRVAILGDSYAEALQLPWQKAFWSVMEQRLQTGCNTLKGKKVEVINFGVSGYGTAQELQTLRYKVWKYDPDLVLLAFLTGNDIRNNSRALEKDPMRPYFLLQEGTLVLDESFLKDKTYGFLSGEVARLAIMLLQHSRILQLANAVRQRLKVLYSKEIRLGAVFGKPRGASKMVASAENDVGLENEIYTPPKNKVWSEAWAVTEALILEMNKEVRNKKAMFLLATLSNGPQVLPRKSDRDHFKESVGSVDLLYPDRRIEKLAKANGIPFIMLAPHLRKWAEEHQRCVHGFENALPCGGHWNENGHQIAGKLLAEQVCRMVHGGSESPQIKSLEKTPRQGSAVGEHPTGS
ncbi:SGNH/GDSL hydrolase family protein [Alcanivorax sp.]|uniref:SGNH/GDSL hydrolase family protein n=1 Tax=Alcanivorax sp. TaxID=1872427 RepID=UPI002585B0F7|nr:SGNH/GDSL hydrolase family protein [Alcanivorax sp.]